ncbi:Hypothetical predicted protein [Mytilus galloprovincialis]|uniref:DUF7869 domain-containing protein n=1 Tax=Mytilus galloprovincialis TaxID=29158 RepID=A0A8B6E9V6_MYTGA|nr:Hypothetical predicted protein [Mytilus galloprovincialis]
MLLFFNRFSSWLGRKAILTLPKLMAGFECYTTPSPTSVRTSHVWDVAGWIGKSLNKISNHSYPHVFKVEKRDGQTKLFYKKWSTDKVWLETTEQLLMNIPTDAPQPVVPILTKLDLNKLKNDIRTSFSYFKRGEDKK